ncbi:MAG: hypothetical protein IJH87_01895 [Atopobiaceae bacterium]|nr:hypothetical protein [Atopobiaceae bacterium]
MADSITQDALREAESLLIAGRDEEAEDRLAALAADLEEYVDRNCETTDEVQWFSFPTPFERLAYRRIEGDPRELRDAGEPISSVYSLLAFAQIRLREYEQAAESLKSCIRWNPMDCRARLDLGELCRYLGDEEEYLALTHSVFQRASEAAHLVRAYAVFANWFGRTGKGEVQAACLHAAERLGIESNVLSSALVDAGEHGPDTVDDAEADRILAEEGLPAGANAEIAVCLLVSAAEAADSGDRALATQLTVRARDLVGAPAAARLLELIRSEGR